MLTALRTTLSSFRAMPTTAALLTTLLTTNALTAQTVAFYPLLTDLLDASANYGPVSLLGNPAPALPNNGVCVNGIYYYSSGQDVRTPLLPTLNTTDFEIDVEFNINAMPSSPYGPVLMGGHLWRWLGIYLQPNGTVGIKHNNSNLAWSTTVLSTGIWYTANLKFEGGVCQLLINGSVVLQVTTGLLSDGNNKNITTNDFSNGRNFNGCIRNLLVLNDTSLGASATPFGAGCTGSAGVPALAPTTLPQLGSVFLLDTTSIAPGSPLAFLAVGFSSTTSPLGPLPFSLQPFGLGAGCNLLVSAEATTLIPVSGGVASYAFLVPADPTLSGLALYFQCAAIDPGATGGFALSNGVEARLGT
jgi:hypothetical protein